MRDLTLCQMALTQAGSRVFSGGLEVKWTPSDTEKSLKIEILGNGASLWSAFFTPDNAVQSFKVDNPPVEAKGAITVVFYAGSGNQGKIQASDWVWDIAGNESHYTGDVGNF